MSERLVDVLAEALRQHWPVYNERLPSKYMGGPFEMSAPELAAAMLDTEPMQAIARQAAIGAAMERLPADESWDIVHERPASLLPGDPPPFGVMVWQRGAEMGAERRGRGPTLPEAIAAALDPEAPTDD